MSEARKLESVTERAARSVVNRELWELSRRYHDGIPVGRVIEILEAHGFEGDPMHGIYCGRDGRLHEKVGERTWIAMSWHKMEESGRYEINAYVS